MLTIVDSGGEAASIPRQRVVLPVAPATAAQSNTLRPPLGAIAGLRLDDLRFDQGGSFIVSHAARELSTLRCLLDDHPGARIAVFGHDDRSRGAEGAWSLAGRRAVSVLGVLLGRADMWRDLYADPHRDDDWKRNRAALSMLDALHVAREGRDVPEASPGAPDSAWFDLLVADYLELLRTCPETGAKLLPLRPEQLLFPMTPTWKGLAQSCSDLNPLRVLPESSYVGDVEGPAQMHATSLNRRVHVYLFPAWMSLDPVRWPCPTTAESRGQCIPRLFLDEAHRGAPTTSLRRHVQGDATFRCRFYDRVTKGSLVEREGESRRISHISVLLRSNSGSVPLARRPCKLHLDGGRVLCAETDGDGALRVPDVPAGEYLLEVDDVRVVVTTLPPEVPAQVVRVPAYMVVERE